MTCGLLPFGFAQITFRGRPPGGTLIRCLNPLNWLLPMQRSNSLPHLYGLFHPHIHSLILSVTTKGLSTLQRVGSTGKTKALPSSSASFSQTVQYNAHITADAFKILKVLFSLLDNIPCPGQQFFSSTEHSLSQALLFLPESFDGFARTSLRPTKRPSP